MALKKLWAPKHGGLSSASPKLSQRKLKCCQWCVIDKDKGKKILQLPAGMLLLIKSIFITLAHPIF